MSTPAPAPAPFPHHYDLRLTWTQGQGAQLGSEQRPARVERRAAAPTPR